MTPEPGPRPAPRPPADFDRREVPLLEVSEGTILYRIHRRSLGALFYHRDADPARLQRWDAPDASYGVCYLAFEDHIAFVETMLRDLTLDAVSEEDLDLRSLALIEVTKPLRLARMCNEHLWPMGADESSVQGSYDVTWDWSAAIHAHSVGADGICYRARHDASGYAVALFERARRQVRMLSSTGLTNPALASSVARWLDRYKVGLAS